MTNLELIASELGWTIPENGDSCKCPKCKTESTIIGGKETHDRWGDIWVWVALTCPNCGKFEKWVEKDWTCKDDLISCLI